MLLDSNDQREVYCECARATCPSDVLENQDATQGPFGQIYCSLKCGEIDGYEPWELKEVETPWLDE